MKADTDKFWADFHTKNKQDFAQKYDGDLLTEADGHYSFHFSEHVTLPYIAEFLREADKAGFTVYAQVLTGDGDLLINMR